MTIEMQAIVDYFLILSGFMLYMVVQGMFINGVYELFRGACVNDINLGRVCSGNLIYKLSPSFFEKHKNRSWSKPFFSCVKCMASFYGSITFWIPTLWLFNFSWFEIFIWMLDIVSLVTVNWIVYKKL